MSDAASPSTDLPPPRRSRVDRALRWVWLIIGIILLALLVTGAGFLAIDALSGLTASPPSADSSAKASDSAGRPQPLRYDPPVPIRGTATRLVLVRRGTGYAYTTTVSSGPRAAEGTVVNAVFLDADGGARLLVDRPAFFRRVAFPGGGARAEAQADSARPLKWIVYEAALADTNGDGRVDDRDRRTLYVSDLDGRGMRAVLPAGFELRDWAGQPDGSVVATALPLDSASGGAMPQRAFVLDPAGTVRPYTVLDSAVARAAAVAGNR